MFKNKKVILSSIAIIFILVVSAIFVNFTLATSTTTNDSGADSGSTSSLVGYSNIDLAIINSNDSSLKASGQDKFNIVQIMPEGYEDYATADTAMTELVTSGSYTGSIQSQENYQKTSSLWKYVYDEAYDNSENLEYSELFRYAVFEQYKTIDDEMAEDAVQLTTVTVSDLNDMDDDAQEILNNADLIYIFAKNYTDYISYDISEDLYSFLDTYATSDAHPVIIDAATLCIEDYDDITGNNDTYRMGALAYKLMTKTLTARYDNVLVTEYDYFATLYTEASGNYDINTVTASKTIADFIYVAENDANRNGSYYIGTATYYKWYVDGSSSSKTKDVLSTFLAHNSSYTDSLYEKINNASGATTGTSSNTSWDFDNAEILVITDGTSSSMADALKAAGSSSTSLNDENVYVYDSSTGVWSSKSSASLTNSTFTAAAYDSDVATESFPSGADIYVISDSNLSAALSGTTTLDQKYLSSSYFEDIETTSVSGTITSTSELSNAKVYLLATDADGKTYIVTNGEYGSATEGTVCSQELSSYTGTYVYTYTFSQLDSGKYYIDTTTGELKSDGTGYTYTPVLVVSDGQASPTYTYYYDSASNAYSYECSNTYKIEDSDSDTYASVLSAYLSNSTYSTINLVINSATDVAALVEDLHDDYTNYVNNTLATSFSIASFSDYDFVFIESGSYTSDIGNTVYNSLCTAVEAGTYVIASGNIRVVSGVTGSDGSSYTVTTVTSPSAKAIADIINAGTYRNGSDNRFRVLEIQPDYPIDLELAESSTTSNATNWVGTTRISDGSTIKGDYYTVPSDVLEGYAKEELDEGTEYYDFDLTKAKIAYALEDYGISYSDIELTQVSTEALIGMTEDIAATYDLVYIGGDISAVDRDVSKMYGTDVFSTPNSSISAARLVETIPTFIMYSHTGYLVTLGSASKFSPTGSKVGDGTLMLATPYIGTTYYSTTYLVENGNDLTETKYEELLSYISTGKPIMVSDELTTIYENMMGIGQNVSSLSDYQLLQGYWYNDGTLEKGNYYLDPNSRMYDLVEALYNAKDTTNVLWGFDSDSEKMIDNTDQDYGITLYTYHDGTSYLDSEVQSESWYGSSGNNSETTIYNYAVVFEDDENTQVANLVNNSESRTRITISSSPTEYSEGVESTYLSTTNLSWSFTIDGSGTYKYVVCVDKNKNNQFEYDFNTEDNTDDYYKTGTVSGGEDTTVNIKLDDDYFGSAYWIISVLDSSGNVVSERTGISKIDNNTDEKSEINVLQVQTMTYGQNTSTWKSYDHLYFDIMSQTSHKIIKYGVYANQESLSVSESKQYASLGRHEYRFGIVEYDYDLYFTESGKTSKGDDNYFTNIADSLTDDYDINLDLVVAEEEYASFTTADNVTDSYDCLDTWVDEAETLESGGTVEDSYTKKSYTKDEYATLASEYQQTYADSQPAVDTAKAALDAYINDAINVLNGGTSTLGNDYGSYGGNYWTFLGGFNKSLSKDDIVELLEYVMDTGEYYMLYFAGYSKNSGLWFQKYTTLEQVNAYYESLGSNAQYYYEIAYGIDFTRLFIAYRDAKDNMLNLEDQYQSYLRKSYGSSFLNKMYSILVIGPSDGFGNYLTDLDVDTCQYILDFVENGGDLFFFHDTMTAYTGDNAGAVNLTTALLDVVGMNRYHVNLTNQSDTYTVTSVNYTDGTNTSGSTTVLTYSGPNSEYVSSADSSKYYLSTYVSSANADGSLVNSINLNMTSLYAGGWYATVPSSYGMYISALSMTTLYYSMTGGAASYTVPYVYADSNYQSVTSWAQSSTTDQSATSGSVNASQLNEGLVTLYPYQIGSTLNISGTHQQAYALDLESDKVTVWYTLAGSNNSDSAKYRSSLYAADPYDAMENYFIYSTYYGDGTITYCGAGHNSITGPTTKNNDERKLFINVIVNSADAVKEKPTLKVYEPDETLTTQLESDSDLTSSTGKTVYLIETDAKTDTVSFDIGITLPSDDVTINSIRIYFDLDWTEDTTRPSYNTDKGDTLIWRWKPSEITETNLYGSIDVINNTNASLAFAIRGLKLSDSYFTYTGGNYTYVVIEVYYNGKETPVYAIIKIKVSDPLFELTEGTYSIDLSLEDYIAEEKFKL